MVCREGAAQLQSELQSLEQQESSMRRQLEHKEQRLQAVEGQIQELQQSIEEHKAELSTELHNHLSAVERQELADFTPRLKQLQVRRVHAVGDHVDGFMPSQLCSQVYAGLSVGFR